MRDSRYIRILLGVTLTIAAFWIIVFGQTTWANSTLNQGTVPPRPTRGGGGGGGSGTPVVATIWTPVVPIDLTLQPSATVTLPLTVTLQPTATITVSVTATATTATGTPAASGTLTATVTETAATAPQN